MEIFLYNLLITKMTLNNNFNGNTGGTTHGVAHNITWLYPCMPEIFCDNYDSNINDNKNNNTIKKGNNIN